MKEIVLSILFLAAIIIPLFVGGPISEKAHIILTILCIGLFIGAGFYILNNVKQKADCRCDVSELGKYSNNDILINTCECRPLLDGPSILILAGLILLIDIICYVTVRAL